ncbi:carboxyl transferase [Desulfatibacillum aliphaticivorans]|uniref:Carboxyl transferase n=1 Tax=Desulfatibacillum aliphaticivorans TaxID=218208 RepID=B8FG38_DESAL|nr:carboxyl transferase domain-containing protein [Desulfatibacillum aliphaticivorans]ACL03718.1 carboxyl transferase [Desulfatibacillum aliphaticivorans]
MAFEKEMEKLAQKREQALAMGGPDKVAKQHAKGRLSARERINKLLDEDSFFEVGMFNHSDMPGMEDKTPADSKIAGYGKVDGRRVIVLANDFTVLAATTSRVAGKKETELKIMSARRGHPLIYLGESGGARMPDIMGSKGLASVGGGGMETFLWAMSRVRQSPMVAGVMGECYGMPTWMACLSDFVVQVKGSGMGVSGPRVLEIALGEKVTDEELGGWQVHSKITGMADAVADNEEHCFEIISKFLSYMPSHNEELPPMAEVPEGSGEEMDTILDLLPEKRNRAYDMHKILKRIVDKDSLFPIKGDFGKTVITTLGRVDGRVVGFVANQPSFQAGAMDTDGIDKVISFLCLCDSFNIPLVFLHDIPGFLVGTRAEKNRVAARVMNYMNALALVTVPKISIIVRKTYGMAFWNMCGSGCGADFLVAWPTAEMSFVDPQIAANVVFGGKEPETKQDKEKWQGMVDSMVDDASPFGAAGMHTIHDVIDPAQTRNYITKALDVCLDSKNGGVSEHKLANWPTKF